MSGFLIAEKIITVNLSKLWREVILVVLWIEHRNPGLHADLNHQSPICLFAVSLSQCLTESLNCANWAKLSILLLLIPGGLELQALSTILPGYKEHFRGKYL